MEFHFIANRLYIDNVDPDSPAAKAGMIPYSTIVCEFFVVSQSVKDYCLLSFATITVQTTHIAQRRVSNG